MQANRRYPPTPRHVQIISNATPAPLRQGRGEPRAAGQA